LGQFALIFVGTRQHVLWRPCGYELLEVAGVLVFAAHAVSTIAVVAVYLAGFMKNNLTHAFANRKND
jgi:hypothetical protein